MFDQLERSEEALNNVIYTAQLEGERIGEARGRVEGEKANTLVVAKRMMENGEPVDKIANYTGLTEDEIKKLAHSQSAVAPSLDEQIAAAALKRTPKRVSLPTDENRSVIIDKEKHPDLYDWAENG